MLLVCACLAGFYGGLGNVGQLNSDSSYLSGGGGQIGGGAGAYGYNYATGGYGAASQVQHLTPLLICIPFLPLLLALF